VRTGRIGGAATCRIINCVMAPAGPKEGIKGAGSGGNEANCLFQWARPAAGGAEGALRGAGPASEALKSSAFMSVPFFPRGMGRPRRSSCMIVEPAINLQFNPFRTSAGCVNGDDRAFFERLVTVEPVF
jgi:hypothetical protein